MQACIIVLGAWHKTFCAWQKIAQKSRKIALKSRVKSRKNRAKLCKNRVNRVKVPGEKSAWDPGRDIYMSFSRLLGAN